MTHGLNQEVKFYKKIKEEVKKAYMEHLDGYCEEQCKFCEWEMEYEEATGKECVHYTTGEDE